MIPGIGGGLSAGGSMPISAGGGAAGPSTAKATNSFGGIKNGTINMGGSTINQVLPLLAVAVVAYLVVKK